MSLLRTFSMMLGELDFVGTYVNTYYHDQLKVPMTSFLILSKSRKRLTSLHYLLLFFFIPLPSPNSLPPQASS